MLKKFALPLYLLLLILPVLGQDQQTLNQQAAARYAEADARLNRVYKKLMAQLTPSEQDKLAAAQRLWIQYRDAHAKARADSNTGGSIYPMIYAGAQRRLTESRTRELQEWLDEYAPGSR